MEFAKKLVALRQKKGWTQAFAAREIGIQQSYLSKLENAKCLPSPEVIKQISDVYQVTKNELALPSTMSDEQYKKHIYWTFSLFFVATLMFIAAHFKLFYGQTFYTYQFSLSSEQSDLPNTGYHISELYLGERYLEQLDLNTIEYRLIGQREVERPENNWLYAVALLFLTLSLMLSLFSYLKRREKVHS